MDLVTTIKASLLIICITLILLDIFLFALIRSISKIGSVKFGIKSKRKKVVMEEEPEEEG